MSNSEFIRIYGIGAFNECREWGRDINNVRLYASLDDINEDYNLALKDAEDVFEEFGNNVRAVVATGEFLINKAL